MPVNLGRIVVVAVAVGMPADLVVQDSFHAEDGENPNHEQRVGHWKHRVVTAAQRQRERFPRLFQLAAGVI